MSAKQDVHLPEKYQSGLGLQIKAAAIAFSDYREVLYLDSDNIPLSDPSVLFDESLYQNGGRAVFWPDFNKDHRTYVQNTQISQTADTHISSKRYLEGSRDCLRL